MYKLTEFYILAIVPAEVWFHFTFFLYVNSIGLGLSNSQPVLHFIDPRLTMLTERRNQYQIAAVNAKHSGNSQQALKYLRIKKVGNWCILSCGLVSWKSKECVTYGGFVIDLS